jgi:hypothetical protein
MRVLFIFQDPSSTVTHCTGAPSYGVASLAACPRAAGHRPELPHLTTAPGEDSLRERVAVARPDRVGAHEGYHALRHRVGERLVRHATALYRRLGGHDRTVLPRRPGISVGTA